MAQMILASVYKLGTGNRFGSAMTRGIPVPFEAYPVPVANQIDPAIFVYAKIRYGAATTGVIEEVYSGLTVAALVTAANA